MKVRYLTLVFLLAGIASPQVTSPQVMENAPSDELSTMIDGGGYPAGYDLIGQVVDASGNGIAGAMITAVGGVAAVYGNTSTSSISATTNATGFYSLNMPSGSYTIMAQLPGYSFTSSSAQIRTGMVSAAQNIIGYPLSTAAPSIAQYGSIYSGSAGWLQGRIVDQTGAGIPFASIIVDGLPAAVLTDEQGSYRLALSPGMHRIEAFKSGYGIPPRVVFILSGQTTNFVMLGMRTIALGRGHMTS